MPRYSKIIQHDVRLTEHDVGMVPTSLSGHSFVECLARICVGALQTMIQPYSNMNIKGTETISDESFLFKQIIHLN